MRSAVISSVVFAIASPNSFRAMPGAAIEKGLKTHDRALHIKDGWIRDPYIIPAPDGYYYLTGTTPLPDDPRRVDHNYNTGLGKTSIVGYKMSLWRSTDLIGWEDLGTPFSLTDGIWHKEQPGRFDEVEESDWRLWAPELHPVNGRWAMVHTSPSPVNGANLCLTEGPQVKGPWENPMGAKIGRRHDPSLFKDDDGTWWLIWGATQIAPPKPDFTDLAAEPVKIGPAGEFARMGHEGCLIRKISGKYVLFGTGWSTGRMRKGSYNLYYTVAERITGPYGPRRFAGRFLGHGTPFRDKAGRWWCTAFFNANVPPLTRQQARGKDLSETAQTINPQGVTIVPLDVVVHDGRINIRAEDPDYARPGPDEAQHFAP